jgi:ABC-type sugar transport system ATPase subunit
MASNGVACVLVTHNLPLAMEMSTRIVVLNRGRKYADISTEEASGDAVVGWITGSRPSMFG